MAFYTGSSPYASTQIIENEYLDVLTIRPVPAKSDDVLYTVEPQYNRRPDLLAYDLYGNEKLWWVFAQRLTIHHIVSVSFGKLVFNCKFFSKFPSFSFLQLKH